MASFESSIEQLLWPEKRKKDAVLGDKVPGVIDRTTTASYLRVPGGFLPDWAKPLLGTLARIAPWLASDEGVEIGPIPAGTPVNLLANLEMVSESDDLGARLEHEKKVLSLLLKAKHDLKSLPAGASTEEQ